MAISISLVGAIVGELPTGAQAGIGARLLSGSYYGQTIQIWAALALAAIMAAGLIAAAAAREGDPQGHGDKGVSRASDILPPVLFGLACWRPGRRACRGFAIPTVLLARAVADRRTHRGLASDAGRRLRPDRDPPVIPGRIMGLPRGFAMALVCDR